MRTKYKRSRLWVDDFQTRLLCRMGFYLLVYAVAVWHIGFAFDVLANVAANGFRKRFVELYLEYLATLKPLLLAYCVTAPLLLYDLLKFSNRIAGPLFRCRRVMDEMAAGKPATEFRPRQRDFMGDLFRAFNGLIRAWNARVGPGTNGQAGETNGTATRTEEKDSPPAAAGAAEPERLPESI
jgi:HAMP domain-containing protein